METIIQRLKAKAQVAPTSTLLEDMISLLEDLQRNPDSAVHLSESSLRRDFAQLQEHGLWERSKENDDLLDALWDSLEAASSKATQVSPNSEGDFKETLSIALPSSQSFAPQLISNADLLVLPLELMDVLNKTYFLHLLATDSGQVLPPGKSLLSVLSRPHVHSEGNSKPTLQRNVEDFVHKAFWDEALESLSSPEPATQLLRLKLFYGDMQAALSRLLPSGHPVLVMLSPPLPPTSSPLESAVSLLRQVLASMRERCAPVRDAMIELEQRTLDNSPVRTSRPVALATSVLHTIRFVLECSDVMKDDLSQAVLGSMSEQQIKSVIAKQAKVAEREAILDLWQKDQIVHRWQSWLEHPQPPFSVIGGAAESRLSWIVRLVQSLGRSSPVACPLPTRTIQTTLEGSETQRLASPVMPTSSDHDNVLPPIFFFSVPTLVKIQNYLQALVIAAALRTLTPLSVGVRPSSTDPTSFTERVWTLLRADIAEEPDASGTKLVNLADEVIRANTHDGPLLPEGTDTKLRAAVDRILKPTSPVFKLLQNRLLTGLVTSLVRPRTESHLPRYRGIAPEILKSGGGGKRPRLVLDSGDMDEQPPRLQSSEGSTMVVVKGFDDPVLNSAMARVFMQMHNQLEWVEGVWEDLIAAESL
ncbi:hypothetical protein V8B97DRAFT_1894433 [Scleroderma yunnanense]